MKILFAVILVFSLGPYDKDVMINQEKKILTLKIEFLNEPAIQKKFYFFGTKSLKIKAQIINNSDNNVYIENIISDATLHFTIKNEKGEDVQENIPFIVDPVVDDNYFKIIKPNGVFAIETDLLKKNKYNFNSDDVYYISAVYRGNNADVFEKNKSELFTEKLESNTLVLKL